MAALAQTNDAPEGSLSIDAALAQIKRIVGPTGWTDSPDAMRPHLEDWRGHYKGRARMVESKALESST